MFIKICGVKNFNELKIVEKFAHATGVVVRSSSTRVLSLEMAKEVIENAQIPVFAVSTENTFEGWVDIIHKTGAEHIQVHSDMHPREFEKIRSEFEGKIIKAFKIPQRCEKLEEEVEQVVSKMSSYEPDYFLLDAGGGSGKLHDLRVSKEVVKKIKDKEKVILAGGLNPANVSEVVNYVKPFGVDVSSGVERGKYKSEQLIRDFAEVVK